MNTETKQEITKATMRPMKLPVTSGISLTLTPEQAMELIKNLSSYAMDGKPFEVTVKTANESWASDTPVAVISCGGFMEVSADLNWSYTSENKVDTIHYYDIVS